MAARIGSLTARLLYGLLFTIVVPAALALWAMATEPVVRLPAYRLPVAGTVLLLSGLTLISWGSVALWLRGGGLPMNAYPPPRLVDRGIYGWLAHPIYVGFVLACGGVSLVSGSSSGLWLVTPFAALGAGALVLGYERLDLRRRFGDVLLPPKLSLPPAASTPPTGMERISVYVLVFLPWLVLYEAIQLMGVPIDAIDSHFTFERAWPVIEWTEIVYLSIYGLVLAAPLVARDGRTLRRFAVAGLVATAVCTILYLAIPLVAPPRPFVPTTASGRLLAREQTFNHTVAAFPAFHVIWAFLAAAVWPRRRAISFAWASAIAISCLTTGMHSVVDVAFALLLVPLFLNCDRAWDVLRRCAQRVANSWREWRFGAVRVINHGAWAGLAAATGTALAAWLAGPDLLRGVVLVSLSTLLGAGLWAQWLEGSSILLRPFGFYGGLLGGTLGSLAAAALGFPVWTILAAFAVALPWTQAIGRMRCLVQGCCHGGPASSAVGIVYRQRRSRVTRIAGLAGRPLHPTPLYSILSNVVAGTLLLRLWWLGVPATFVVGSSLILNGLARFVEESYRAEPQTRVIGGLHIYHWIAVGTVVIGMAASSVGSAVTSPPTAPGVGAWLAALTIGLLTSAAMGVDFPESNRRFSRLAAADEPSERADSAASRRSRKGRAHTAGVAG